MPEVSCSFCNKTKREVAVMISGVNAHICEECVAAAQKILSDELKAQEAGKKPKFNLIKPRAIKEHLDQYVVGQDDAKRVMAVAVYILITK